MLNKFLVCLLAICLSGCAFGTRRPVLKYDVKLPAAAKNNVVVKVAEFNDERTWSKEKIGNVKNGYGARCADIIPQNSVTGWITDALKNELSNAGYTVSEDDDAANVISGIVLEVYTDAYWNYGGRVRLHITLKKQGEELLNQDYSAQKNCGMQWAATAVSFGKTMEMTLQDLMRKVIPDINNVLLSKADATQ